MVIFLSEAARYTLKAFLTHLPKNNMLHSSISTLYFLHLFMSILQSIPVPFLDSKLDVFSHVPAKKEPKDEKNEWVYFW